MGIGRSLGGTMALPGLGKKVLKRTERAPSLATQLAQFGDLCAEIHSVAQSPRERTVQGFGC